MGQEVNEKLYCSLTLICALDWSTRDMVTPDHVDVLVNYPNGREEHRYRTVLQIPVYFQ